MIKSNIDLTSNEMFSRATVPAHYWNILHNILPWNRMDLSSITSDDDSKFEGIVTGNREERNLKILCYQVNMGDYCDCCGASLTEIPWNRTWGLCHKCISDMESRLENQGISRFPWKVDNEIRAARGIVSLNW